MIAMAFRLIQADQNILDKIQLFMEDPEPVDGWTTGSGKIELQFPPRIKSKSKSAQYKVEEKGFYEPVAVWKGATGTKIDVELKYVVTGGKWNIKKISDIEHNIMGYFYRSVITLRSRRALPPLIRVALYKVVPDSPNISKWRLENASSSYSEELIIDGNDIYPQVVTISLAMVMVTRIVDVDGRPKVPIDAPDKPLKEWY